MTWLPRHIYMFESDDGSYTYKVPKIDYEWEPAQGLRRPVDPISGGNYGVDYYGIEGRAFKDFGSERIRFSLYERCGPTGLDDAIDDIKTNLYEGMLGKLWTIGADGTKRWSHGALISMPEYVIRLEKTAMQIMSMAVEFRRYTDWYSSVYVEGELGPYSSDIIVDLDNPGRANVFHATFVLRGTAWDGINIENLTTDYRMKTFRDITATTQRVKFDAGRNTVEYSTDSGINYTNDYANFDKRANQTHLMRLQPGNNQLEITANPAGMNAVYVAYAFYPAYH